MVETRDSGQLRLLNLELLRQLWAGQDAVRRSVAKAVSEAQLFQSSLDSGRSYDSETKLSPETSSASSGASRPQDLPDAHRGDPCDEAWLGKAPARAASLPLARSQHPEPLGRPRPHSAPSLATAGLKEPAPHDPRPQEAQAPRSILAPQSKLAKHRVTFCQESTAPESSWRLRQYLGYDWIAGVLDSSSPVTSKPEDFFSTLQRFRDSNKAECVYSGPEPQSPGLRESDDVEEDHECVYCYRVNRRLFPVPSDPGVPCRLCGTPRDQRSPEAWAEPAQVRVSIPLSVLDPPHRYRIHRRKSFDASDTLALPRHCLLGWDILPPKSEKSSAPKSLDLWSSVCEAQRRELSATNRSRLALPARAPPPAPVWSEAQVTRSQVPQQKP